MEEETIFSQIIDKKKPAEIIFEDEEVIAFKDINPQAPVHVLIVPRKPIPKLTDADESDTAILGKMVMVARQIAKDFGLDEDGFRLLLNEGKNGGQTIYHLHFHLLGGRRLMWPPG
ncbi:MAG: histidine triad nucleotide-binding protein [Calditrichia bacterium]|nr:histidine triad nucleotide-binding protein [Calditrichia bacterium]